MAVTCETELGWFVDHHKWIDEAHNTSIAGDINEPTATHWKSREELFAIHSPFLMDTQFNKLQQQATAGNETTFRSKKRKRKMAMNDGELKAIEFHQKIINILEQALHQIVSVAKRQIALLEAPPGDLDNNITARKASGVAGPGDSLREMCNLSKLSHRNCDGNSAEAVAPTEFGRMCMNPAPHCETIQIMGQKYVLPPNATYLMSDISQMDSLTTGSKKYDCIILDPPWENKSVKRKKMYYTLCEDELLQMPVGELLRPGGLVAVWVTNKQRQQEFVTDVLLPHWNAAPSAHWYWLKVTTSGQTVYSLDSLGKKPYECLILGRSSRPAALPADKACESQVSGSAAPPVTLTDDGDIQEQWETGLPQDRVIISVPCSIHSRKPPLNEILSPYLPKEPNCLEMFARSLMPKWTSWGNEQLRSFLTS